MGSFAPLPVRTDLEAGDTLPAQFTLGVKDNFVALASTDAGSGASLMPIQSGTLSGSGADVQAVLVQQEAINQAHTTAINNASTGLATILTSTAAGSGSGYVAVETGTLPGSGGSVQDVLEAQQTINQQLTAGLGSVRKAMTFMTEVILDGQNQLTGANAITVSAPKAGYIVAASISISGARTAGTIAVEPHKNGTGLTPTDLDLAINGSDTLKDYASIAYGTANYNFVAGDTIGLLVTTSSFTPLSNILTLTLQVELT